jgi:hypothetical protein
MPWWPRSGDGYDITEAVGRLVTGTMELLKRAAATKLRARAMSATSTSAISDTPNW